ncbi:MAG: hypothetical protein ABIS17_14990 [Casimicrobiaceae bacterium]
MARLYEILHTTRRDGLMAIEQTSKAFREPHFRQVPLGLHDHHLMEFITDYLRLMVSGNMIPDFRFGTLGPDGGGGRFSPGSDYLRL